MYRIIGQPINLCYIKDKIIVEKELSEESKQIIKICEFGLKHGYKIGVDAFDISKSTYYKYLKLYNCYKEFGVHPQLTSKKPHNVRKNNWHKKVVRFIVNIRKNCPNIGKSKIKYYLDKYCITHHLGAVSTGTIQNIII